MRGRAPRPSNHIGKMDMASTNLTRAQTIEAEQRLAKHLQPTSGSSETSSMTEEQKNFAFETAMRVIGNMGGAPDHREMREIAEGVIAAAIAAADKLKAIAIAAKP